MGNLIENRIISDINKARTGRYEDNSKNRRLHRVGQEYGNKGGEKEDEKSSEKKDDNSRIIQALESKIEQMKKNKHIFVEQGGEVRYNRALETLQSKLDSAKGEERKESVRDKASEKKEKTDSDYEKVNEARKKETEKKEESSSKKNAEMDIKEARKELLGKKITFKEYFFDGVDSYKDAVGEIKQVRLYGKEKQPVLAAEFPNGDSIQISLKQLDECKALTYEIVFDEKVSEEKPDKKETSNEEAEVYTRIKFEDVPNSGKINLKKYLSEKVRKGVDEKWSNIKNISTENLKKMEKGLVNDLNKNFEAIKKSQRAELLYSIMKVKGELESRGKENKGE